jgi:hypothetical protein
MPTKILKYKYGINLKDMYVNEIENNSESNGFTICESTWNNKDESTQNSTSKDDFSYKINDLKMEIDSNLDNENITFKRKRDQLIEKHGREKVRFHGNSTILIDSEKYKVLRKLNNESSKRSKKRREAREKLENFFILTIVRNLMENKKRLNQEIQDLKIQNEKLLTTNTLLKMLLKTS